VAAINRDHVNPLFLPDAPLAPAVRATGDLAAAVRSAEVVVSAAPSHVVRVVMAEASRAATGKPLVVSVSKGLEPDRLVTLFLRAGPGIRARHADRRALGTVVRNRGLPAPAHRRRRRRGRRSRRPTRAAGILQRPLPGLHPHRRPGRGARGRAEERDRSRRRHRRGTRDGSQPPCRAHHTRPRRDHPSRRRARRGPTHVCGPRRHGRPYSHGDRALSRNRSLGWSWGREGRSSRRRPAGRVSPKGSSRLAPQWRWRNRHDVELPISREVAAILFEGKAPREAIADLMERDLKAEQWR